VEAIAILAQREALAKIVGPVRPRLSASELHRVIEGAAAPTRERSSPVSRCKIPPIVVPLNTRSGSRLLGIA
jgi:hypothetical protein